MDGRPLVNNEFWEDLIPKSSGRNSPFKDRDNLLLGLACICGLREIELTQITIGLFIAPTGEFNEFIVLPESITYDGYERPIMIAQEQLKEWFVKYIVWLINHKISTQQGKSHQGLNPNANLFLDDDYKPFTVQSRGNGALSPNKMNKHLDSLIVKSGLWVTGIRRKSFIRACTISAYRSNMSVNDIIITTGQSEETIKKTLVMDYQQYSPIADWFEEQKTRKAKRLASFKKRRKFQI